MSRFHTLEEGISIAVDSIRANKTRSGLTILGVAIGVGVVVTMAALITGIRSSIIDGFESAGPDNFTVQRFDFTGIQFNSGGSRPPWWNKPRVEAEEAERLAELPGVEASLYNFAFSTTMIAEERRITGVQSQAYSTDWVQYAQGHFSAGRDFTPQELRQSRPVVVISTDLAETLYGDRDPIGRKVRVSAGRRGVNEAFRIIGVFEADDNIFSAAIKDFAIFPYTTAMKRLKASNWQAGIWIVPKEGALQADVIDNVVGAMRGMRGLRPQEEDNFAILRSDQLLDTFNQITSVFFLVMMALSSVGLLVGGIGVVGIMMISVTERTREIGIRKAVGATRQEILWQFLVEAAVLTLLGGAAGMALGAGLAELVASQTPLPASIPLWAVATALAMAVLTGMLFGLVPAYRASRMNPVTALGHEL